MVQTRRFVARRLWDLDRFGFTPRKVWARVCNAAEPRVMIISVPKAGTHLIERAVCLHPRLYRPLVPTLHSGNIERFGGLIRLVAKLGPGGVLVSHLHYSRSYYEILKQANVKCIFVVRDPRDIVVSEAFYVANNRRHPYHPHVAGLSTEEKLRRAIVGDKERGYLGLGETLQRFSGWLDTDVFIARYEEFVNRRSRHAALEGLFGYLGLELARNVRQRILNELVSDASPTFRQGNVGGWSEYLRGELYQLLCETAGDMILRYGYTS